MTEEESLYHKYNDKLTFGGIMNASESDGSLPAFDEWRMGP